ncbi:unnamed protein product [Diplocarpon coronariae]|nr:hypothetical protein JHW43_007582 [Diplocarpon mali]
MKQLQQPLQWLLVPGIDYNHPGSGPPIHFSAWCGNLNAMELLLAAAADPLLVSHGEFDGPVGSIVGRKLEALLWAPRRWNFAVVALLVSRTTFDQPAVQETLHAAVTKKMILSTELNDKHEGIEYVDQHQLIALMDDSGSNLNPCALKTLIKKGADSNKIKHPGKYALHILAAPVGLSQDFTDSSIINETAIWLLLQHGASVSLHSRQTGLIGTIIGRRLAAGAGFQGLTTRAKSNPQYFLEIRRRPDRITRILGIDLGINVTLEELNKKSKISGFYVAFGMELFVPLLCLKQYRIHLNFW